MFALIGAVMRALKNGLTWLACAAGDLLMFPFRLFAPPSGRSAIPSAPPRKTQPVEALATTIAPTAPTQFNEHRQAAMTVMWLAKRLRQGSAVGELSPQIDKKVARWAMSLTDDQSKQAIGAGFMRVSEHVAGRNPIAGLPPATVDVVKAEADDANDRAAAPNMIRTRNRRPDYAPAAMSSMI